MGALALAVCSVRAGAQNYPADKIVFSGSSLSQGELLRFTGLQPGQVTRAAMQAAADRLTGTGLFFNVKYSVDGGTLMFALEPSPGVVPVEYDNFPWWDDKALNTAVAAQVPLFHGALDPRGTMRDEVTAALVSLLAAKDVRGATVAAAPVSDADGTPVAIRYHIDTPAVVIAAFHIDGYSGVWTQPVEAVERSAFREKIDRATRAMLADEVRAAYGKLGFVDMRMTEPVWGQPRMVNGEVAVPLTASIQSEGGEYHVAAIHVNGDLFMTQEQFAQSAKLHPGDVADEVLWKQTQEMVEAPYRTRGYLKAKMDAQAVLDRAQHTVDYTITIEPGADYRMGRLTLVNLNDRQRAELMPYWLLHKGDVFNPDLMQQSIREYHQKRAPETQSIRAGYRAQWSADTVTHIVDVVLTFDAQPN